MGRLAWMALLAIGGLLSAQQPSFEVASIRENADMSTLRGWKSTGNTLRLQGYTVGDLILDAYGLKGYQLARESLPVGVNEISYNVEAKAAGAAPTRAEFQMMLRSLLAERFALKFHKEMRSVPVYALEVDKTPALKPATGETECAAHIGPVQPTDRNYRYRFVNCTLDSLVVTLQADRPVVDRTGLTGRYDIEVFATPDFKMQRGVEPGDIAIQDAIRTLGLRLRPANAPVEVLVVDKVATRPTAN